MRWMAGLAAGVAAAMCVACAAPFQRASPASPLAAQEQPPRLEPPRSGRPTVGVAFGGGSAKGIAHVGVIRWLEEHRIPIDVAAGTSELRGRHYYVATGGYLRRVGRLPDFLGGPIFAGGWLENGDAFADWNDAGWKANGSAGVVMDTLVGPLIIAESWSFDGRWRTYFGVGRLFR